MLFANVTLTSKNESRLSSVNWESVLSEVSSWIKNRLPPEDASTPCLHAMCMNNDFSESQNMAADVSQSVLCGFFKETLCHEEGNLLIWGSKQTSRQSEVEKPVKLQSSNDVTVFTENHFSCFPRRLYSSVFLIWFKSSETKTDSSFSPVTFCLCYI